MAVPQAVREAVGMGVAGEEAEGVGKSPDGEAVGLLDCTEAVGEAVAGGVAVAAPVALIESEARLVCVAALEAAAEKVARSEAETEGVGGSVDEAMGEADARELMDCVVDGVGLCDEVGEGDCVGVRLGVGLSVGVLLLLEEGVCEGEGVPETVAV